VSDPKQVIISGNQSVELRVQASGIQHDEEEESAAPSVRWPYPINVGGAQFMPGRKRRCGFWISPIVPLGTRYIIDSTQLLQGGSWTHNPAGDSVPEDALLVVVSPSDADHIRKAMATWKAVPHPSAVAARIIDAECRKDPTLCGRLGWK
jgi:hypothetical protein